MQKYVISTLAVIIIFLCSVIYKHHHSMVFTHFPVPEEVKADSEAPLYLFLYLTKKDCPSCLTDIIKTLNRLKAPYHPVGIIPAEEMANVEEVKSLIGVSFPVISDKGFRKYLPWRTPLLLGVSPAGKIIFVLPGIGGESQYLATLIQAAYGKLCPMLEEEQNHQIQ